MYENRNIVFIFFIILALFFLNIIQVHLVCVCLRVSQYLASFMCSPC